MRKYLSIGEVSKMKGVSIKSLRYYGELGILPPAYINDETGYRYYSVEQLIVVDLISVCIDLGIPLKNFHNYITENDRINTKQLLADGEEIVMEKICQLTNTISFLKTMSEHVSRTNRIKNIKGEFLQHIPKRYFLTIDWSGNYNDFKEISSKLSNLYKQCKELCIADSFNQGTIYQYTDEGILSKIFLEIPKYVSDVNNLLIIEEEDFICDVISDEQINTFIKKYVDNKTYPSGSIIIIKELFDLTIELQSSLLETQRFTSVFI